MIQFYSYIVKDTGLSYLVKFSFDCFMKIQINFNIFNLSYIFSLKQSSSGSLGNV